MVHMYEPIAKFIIFILLIIFCVNPAYAKHLYKEADYQNVWCVLHNGVTEYENKDFTRVDCLTATHAVEFDFANKWAESIGQALHYSLMTGKKGMVVLILENPKLEMVYYYRVKKLSELYNFDVEYVTPEIFNNSACKKSKNSK